VLSDP